jgi:hypothetical protein
MVFFPGQLVAVATFPGVIVHEMAHQLFCRILRLSVLDVCYFRVGNPAGYVLHEPARSPVGQIMISVGPFLVNTALGAVLSLPAAIQVLQFHAGGSLLDYFLLWLGVSIAMHAFPSTGDAAVMRCAVSSPYAPWWAKVVGYPLVGLIYLGAVGSMFWLDLAYGIAIALLLPRILVALIA